MEVVAYQLVKRQPNRRWYEADNVDRGGIVSYDVGKAAITALPALCNGFVAKMAVTWPGKKW